MDTIAKKTIIEELNEQIHPERVEDVIVWALEHYAKREEPTLGRIIAHSIVENIKEQEIRIRRQSN